MLCRACSTGAAIVWVPVTAVRLFKVAKHAGAVNVLTGEARLFSYGQSSWTAAEVEHFRVCVLQIGLSYLWAGTSAYLAHLFVSSLMSRWLLHYSPFAVTLRLLSMSIILSYAGIQLFRLLGAFEPNLSALSRSFPIWIIIAIVLLLLYFCTQQDISVEGDRDDRRRRLLLRIKCLYAIAGSSLLSLLAMVCLLHYNMVESADETWAQWFWRQSLGWEKLWNETVKGTKLEL